MKRFTIACLAVLALALATTPAAAAPTDPPVLSVSGQTITWSKVDGTVTSYKFVDKVPGQADLYYTVTCSTDPCSLDPRDWPGLTVRYGARTNVTNSRWATEVSIAYPAAEQPTDAPVLSVSGDTITWDRVAGVASYVGAVKIPGQATQYPSIACSTDPCSWTPAAVPGQTVNYGMRTNVTGSVWAREVQIAYAGSGGASTLALGVNGPGDWLALLHATALATHPNSVRLDTSRMSTTAAKDAAVNQVRSDGVRPEFLYVNRSTAPSSIRSDALRYGPTSTSDLPLLYVEFGNEDSYSYKNATASTARTYGSQVAAVANALAGTGVKVIVQADDANINSTTNWVANMYSTFPDMDSNPNVGGWVIHPYGPGYMTRLNRLVSQTTAQGAPASFPIFVTEYGLSSDNGRCLSDNYGWDKCMTYVEAGQTITSVYHDIDANAPAVVQLDIYNAGDGAAPGASTDRELYFGELRRDMTPKPGYTDVLNTLGS